MCVCVFYAIIVEVLFMCSFQVPKDMDLRYYTSALHSALFVLPKFIADELDQVSE